MTKKTLIKRLEEVEEKYKDDEEVMHGRHDDLLLEYINDSKITEIFNRSTKWYA